MSPDGEDGSLSIDQDARLYAGFFADGEEDQLSLGANRAAWVHVARGNVKLNDVELGPGDGAAVQDVEQLTLTGVDDAELVVWELPAA